MTPENYQRALCMIKKETDKHINYILAKPC